MRDEDGAARAIQRFVRCEAEDIGDADRVGIDAGGDQTGDVGDIGEQVSADGISDLAIGIPIGREGIAAEAADDQARPLLERELHHLLVVQAPGLRVDRIADDLVILAAAVDRAAVRKMAAHDQVHAHHRVADIQQGAVYSVVGGRAGKRLDIDVKVLRAQAVAGEEFRRPPPRQGLDDIGVFRAFVIALVRIAAEFRQALVIIEDFPLRLAARVFQRIALGIDVVKRRTEGIAHREGHGAFRWDEDEFFLLPGGFVPNQFRHIRVELVDAAAKEKVSESHGWGRLLYRLISELAPSKSCKN